MHLPSISDRPPLISLLRILAVVILFGWVILGQVLALVVAALYYDGNLLAAFSDPLAHPDLRDTILLSQGVAAFTAFIFMPWFYLKIAEKRELNVFFKGERQWPMLVVLIMIATITLAFAISPFADWNANLQFPEFLKGFGQWVKETEELAAAIVKTITNNMSPATFFFSFLVVAVLPGIGEELVFRGLIQTELHRAIKNPHVAIWITAILFSAFHMQFLGFLPRMFIGAFLGYLYYWSGNLWIPILGHFFNNGLQIIGLYLYQKGVISFDVESTDMAPWSVVFVSVILFIGSLYYLNTYFQSSSPSFSDVDTKL